MTKYVPLLPKITRPVVPAPADPPEPASHLPRQSTVSSTDKRCPIRACRRKNCTLRSHYYFARGNSDNRQVVQSRFKDDGPAGSNSTSSSSSSSSLALTPTSPFEFSIIRGGVDGLPLLPLHDGTNDKVYRELFHYFCIHQYDRIRRIVAPPPITEAQKRAAAELKTKSLTNAMIDPVRCLSYVATAKQQLNFIRDEQEPDRNTIMLHCKIMQQLRTKLDNLTGANVGELILIIYSLVMFDIAVKQIDGLHAHRRVVEYLVSSCGGVHNFGLQASVILTLDRTISMLLGVPALYPPAFKQVRRPARFPHVYGTFFEQRPPSTAVDDDVREYCFDACRAIEIFEREGWSFDPLEEPMKDSPDLHYFYYHRDGLAYEFVRLSARTPRRRDLSRCVLLAAKIIDYIVTQGNYIVRMPARFADEIHDIASANEFAAEWEQHSNVLLWIMFVLACMPAPWQGRPKALTEIKRRLDSIYNTAEWPVEWRQQQLDNVRRFVWSDNMFGSNYIKICREVAELETHDTMEIL